MHLPVFCPQISDSKDYFWQCYEKLQRVARKLRVLIEWPLPAGSFRGWAWSGQGHDKATSSSKWLDPVTTEPVPSYEPVFFPWFLFQLKQSQVPGTCGTGVVAHEDCSSVLLKLCAVPGKQARSCDRRLDARPTGSARQAQCSETQRRGTGNPSQASAQRSALPNESDWRCVKSANVRLHRKDVLNESSSFHGCVTHCHLLSPYPAYSNPPQACLCASTHQGWNI